MHGAKCTPVEYTLPPIHYKLPNSQDIQAIPLLFKKKKARTRINAYTMYILPHPLRIEEMSKHQFTTCELGSNDQIKKWGDG